MVTSNYRARARGLPKSWYLSADIDSASVTALCGENGLRYSGSDMFRFRAASKAWQDCFDAYSAQNPPGVTVMRRGIDECFLELTALALARIQRGDIRVLAEMDAVTKAKLQVQAQERMRVAEAKWRAEESKLDPSIPRESIGGVRAAIRASASSDPMTAKSLAKRGNRFPSGQVASPAKLKAEPATVVTSASPLPLVVIGSESLLTLPPHLVGKSEAEIEAYCNQLHPIDFCRGDKHTQDAPMSLYTRAALDQLAQQGTQLQVDPHSPWVGQVLLSGWNPSESQSAFRTRPRDTYAHTPGSHNLDAAATFGETVPSAEEQDAGDSDVWGDAQGLEEEGELDFEGEAVAATSSAAAAASSSSAAVTAAASSSPPLFAPVSGMDWSEADLVVPPLFDSSSSPASAASSGVSHDLILAVGSQIAFELRSLLFARMGLTTSACVAPNCMLAKLGSQMHKPNQQSIIRPSVALAFLRPLALKRVPQFGPKAQARVHPLGLAHIAQVQSLLASTGTPTVPPPVLLAHLPPKLAQTLTNIANGVDDTIVKRLGAPKSLAQEKGQLIRTDEDMIAQLGWLADQLARRLQIHELEWNMRATSLSIGWRPLNPSVPRGSASAPLPSVLFASASRPGAEIEAVALKLWRKSLGSPFPPLKYLGLGVHTWKPLAKEKEKLGNYFQKQTAAPAAAAASALTNSGGSAKQTELSASKEEEEDLLSLLEARDSAHAAAASVAAASSSSSPAPPAASVHSDPIDSLMGVAASAASVSNGDFTHSSSLPSASAAAATAAAAASFPCTQCPAQLSSPLQLQEHLDFHFAQQYQQRVRAEDREQREAQQAAQLAQTHQQAQLNKKSKPNKRTATAAAAASPATTIARFFHPPAQPK